MVVGSGAVFAGEDPKPPSDGVEAVAGVALAESDDLVG